VQHSYILGPVALWEFEFISLSYWACLDCLCLVLFTFFFALGLTIQHIYNSEKETKSTTTADICNNQEDYDPTLVLIADNIDISIILTSFPCNNVQFLQKNSVWNFQIKTPSFFRSFSEDSHYIAVVVKC
jgi:hypothetical protein